MTDKTTPARSSAFTVDFGDTPLSPEFRTLLDRRLRLTTMQTLAELDLQGDSEIRYRFPKEWMGIFIRPDKQIAERLRSFTR